MSIQVGANNITFNDGTVQSGVSRTGEFRATVLTTGPGNYDVTANGVRAGLRYIKVWMYGAGGGGGNSSVAGQYGGRGAYGPLVRMYIPKDYFPAPGLIPYTIGAGGAGANYSPVAPASTAGTAGGSSSFNGVTAPGGVGGPAATTPGVINPAMTASGSVLPSLKPGGAQFTITSGASSGGVSQQLYSLQNGYVCYGVGDPGDTAGVPIWYDLVYGAGSPVSTYPQSSPVNGTSGTGYGTGGGAGVSGPVAGASGGNGSPGVIFIEEYY